MTTRCSRCGARGPVTTHRRFIKCQPVNVSLCAACTVELHREAQGLRPVLIAKARKEAAA